MTIKGKEIMWVGSMRKYEEELRKYCRADTEKERKASQQACPGGIQLKQNNHAVYV